MHTAEQSLVEVLPAGASTIRMQPVPCPEQRTAARPVRAREARVSVVVPVVDEAHTIGWVMHRIPPYVDEVVLVDGESADGTVELARLLRPGLVVVQEPRAGKGAALRAGFAAATGDYIVMIDGDCSMDPQEIGRYLDVLDWGLDFVKGSRRLAGGNSLDLTVTRYAGNRALTTAVNLLYGCHFTDLCYGFCAFRRDVLDALNPASTGFEIETELIVNAVRAGLRVGEVPSTEHPRAYGVSNLHPLRDGTRALRTLVSRRFPRAALQLGLAAPCSSTR
jgi:glycosyltransferase involved in cell wall biosynthesis